MGLFDDERAQLGIQPKESATKTNKASKPSEKTVSKSIFADERSNISNPPKQPTYQEQQKKFGTTSVDPSKSPVMQAIKTINSQPPVVKPKPVSNYDDRKNDKSRNIPIIGTILKGLDKLSDTKAQHVVADVGQALYTPGGGAANVAGLFGASEKGIAKIAPNLVGNVAGRVAQKVGSGAITAFPEGVGQYQAQGGDNVKEALKAGALSSALGGSLGALGGLTGELVSQIKKDRLAASFDKMFPAYEQAANNIKSVKPVGGVVKETDAFSKLTPAKQFDLPNAYQKKITLGLPASKQYDEIQRIKAQQPLSLPVASPKTIDELNRRNGNIQPTNTNPIYGQGNVADPLGLPQGNYVKPTRLKVNNANETLDHVITKIRPEVIEIIEAPARRDLLQKYIQKNTGYEMSDILNRPMKELQELGQVIQDDLHGKMEQIAYGVAKKHGYDLPALFKGESPSITKQVAKDAQSRVYGVPAEKVNTPRPKFNKEVTGQAAAPKQGLAFKREPKVQETNPFIETPLQKQQRYEKQIKDAENNKKIAELSKPIIGRASMPETKIGRPPTLKESATKIKPKVEPVKGSVTKTRTVQKPKVTMVLPDEKIKGQELKNLRLGDETGFANTVKNSDNTAAELKKALADEPVTGARTTDVLNRQDANKIINKHGLEGTHDILMDKKKQFSAAENTAAQIVAKHLSSLGGDDNLKKAINLISKTAKGGREMGQAIQALSQWNKLDETGALMIGEKQLNKGIKNTEDWKTLTVEQGKPITEAAQRIGKAQATKNLADEVLTIVTNKADGAALTEAEKATIKEFQDQVKLINQKGKGILAKPKVEKVVDKANETIKKVSQIEPKARTRDQVVSFLDAKADKARKRLAASRNLGFAASADKGNPIVDWAIIGAAHLAKKAVKLSDFTELMVRDFGSGIKPHINEVFTKATNIFRRENGLPTVEHLDRVVNTAVKNERFSPEQAKQFKAWASEIGHMSEGFKREATQDLQAAMKELGDSTLGDKIATLQTGAQLLNVVTIGRNAIGNGALIASEKISKLSAVPIDWTLSKLTGERTIQFNPHNQEKLIKNFIEGTDSGWAGVSPTGTLDSYGVRPNVFGNKNPLKYVSKSLGASMQGFDNAAYRQAYGDVLATYGEQMGKAQGLSKAEIKSGMAGLIEKLDKRIFELADEAGLYATFQDETLLSQGAEMLKRGLNKITDLPMQKIVDKGLLPQKFSTEGFGLGDIVLKYAKTPANLIMRAIDYSPLGFIRGIGELAPLVFNKAKFNQFQATRSLSRAITGTLGLTGVGYVLADAGILTGSSSLDKDKRSIQEQSGQGAYKVNWSALTRYITSGLDKKAAEYQKGDRLMDYQWLQPAAISVAMGVNANRAVKDKKEGADITGWKIAEKALLGGLQTILENPMVQGLSGVVDAGSDILKRQDPTKAKSLLKGVPATFVPTLLNQWRTATDNKQRETFSKNLLTEMGNLIKNKIPGVSKKLPISYDSLGNAREKIQGGKENTVGQYLTAFFSPARMTEYQVSDEAKLVLDLMDKSGDASVLPRIGNKYFNVKQGKNEKDLKVNLDAKQFSQLQKNLGEMVSEALAKKSEYLSNPNISLEHKVDAVKKILTDVGAKARVNIGTQMGYKKKDIKS